MFLLSFVIRKNKDNKIVQYAFFGIRAGVLALILNALIFILMAISDGNFFDISTRTIYKFGGLVSIDNLDVNLDLIRIITSGFLHAGIIHLIFNMYALYVLGPQLESFFGKWKYLFIYLRPPTAFGFEKHLLSLIWNYTPDLHPLTN